MKKIVALLLVILTLFSAISVCTLCFAEDGDDTYYGGFRCQMCDLFDKIKSEYPDDSAGNLFYWIITLVHTIVHSVSAKLHFE